MKAPRKRFIKAHNEECSMSCIWKKSADSILTAVARTKLSLLDKAKEN